MIIVLTASYTSIPIMLSLLLQKGEEFRILTPDKNIYDFFCMLFDKNYIIFYNSPNYSLYPFKSKGLINKISDINKYKKCLKELINQWNSNEIYTSDIIAFCEFEFWLVRELSRNNNIKFCPVVTVEDSTVEMNNLKGKLYEFINFLVYHTKPKACISDNRVTLRISESYLKSINSEYFKIGIDYVALNNLINEKFNLPNSKYLLLAGGVAGYFVDKENYVMVTDKIITFIENEFGNNNIAVKSHPRFREYYSKENSLNKISPLIPASLIVNNFECVIGYFSTSLCEASKAGKKVITTVKLFNTADTNVTNMNTQYLISNMNSENPILFPENFEEFKSIIKC
ncbi:MAG: hypothetical protein EPN82_13955 [Bacteroidetes bacterium]|nr:MAG: hypothetical protein EPN82_13955 [Bacteroidota bacterium]